MTPDTAVPVVGIVACFFFKQVCRVRSLCGYSMRGGGMEGSIVYFWHRALVGLL